MHRILIIVMGLLLPAIGFAAGGGYTYPNDHIEIDWDDGPYFQSKRLDIYHQYIQRLLDTGKAYYCTCSPQELEAMRQKGMAAGGKPKYDGTCRDKGLSKEENAVVRFKAPLTGTTVLSDVIKGNIVFQNSELDDFIIARSDGTPTYNFCVVIDDLTTTGGSKFEAIEKLTAAGLKVQDVIVLIDRQSGASEALAGGVTRVVFADGRPNQPVRQALAGADRRQGDRPAVARRCG